jgi:hypothetical protein
MTVSRTGQQVARSSDTRQMKPTGVARYLYGAPLVLAVNPTFASGPMHAKFASRARARLQTAAVSIGRTTR